MDEAVDVLASDCLEMEASGARSGFRVDALVFQSQLGQRGKSRIAINCAL